MQLRRVLSLIAEQRREKGKWGKKKACVCVCDDDDVMVKNIKYVYTIFQSTKRKKITNKSNNKKI